MFRIAICEDIAEERKKIIEKIDAYFRKEDLRYLVNEYSSGESLLAEFEDEAAVFDLIIMDIRLGGMNGLDASAKIREFDSFVPIAFLTASRDFAIESYDVSAVAYMLKPVEEDKFFTLLSRLTRTKKPKCLCLKMRGRTKCFDYRALMYLESQGHRVILHLADGTEETAYYKLDDIASMLEDERFVRTHKSYLVNLEFVDSADEDFQLFNGTVVPIRRRGRKAVLDSYHRYTAKEK